VGKNDPTAMNIVATVVVTGGDDDGVTVKCWFSQKPGKQDMLSKFTGSFGKTGNVNVGQEYDLDKCIGQKVQGYCQVDHISGWNKITDWRPVQG
jgi:hypothetical protein